MTQFLVVRSIMYLHANATYLDIIDSAKRQTRYLKGSVQQCVKSEIDVLRKGASSVFNLVIYIRIGKWPNDDIIMIVLIS